jgi:hypothetical protein
MSRGPLIRVGADGSSALLAGRYSESGPTKRPQFLPALDKLNGGIDEGVRGSST